MKAKKPYYIAHRGAMNVRPENMLSSFQAAIEAGHDALELDIRVTKDGQVVVFHDENFARLAGRSEKITTLSWQEVQKITIGDEHIPRLETVLTALPQTTIYIEIKDPQDTAHLYELLTSVHHQHSVIVISKSLEALHILDRLDQHGQFERGYVSNKRIFLPKQYLQSIGANYFVCHQWTVNWLMMWSARRHAINVVAYPVSNKLYSRILKGHAVHGLVLDVDPDQIS